ncbi:hypothetical protein J1781_11640 [Rahnella sp. C60]|nr:hypothetical protein [Rahnella perminowiae]
MKKLCSVLFLILMVGCSTNPVALNNAKNVPLSQALKFQSPKNGDTKLVVIRDSGITGSGCYAAIFVNGEKSALLNTSEKTTLYLPPGEYIIGVAFDGSGWCSMGKERQEQSVVLKSDNEKVVRVYTDGNGNLDIKPTTL